MLRILLATACFAVLVLHFGDSTRGEDWKPVADQAEAQKIQKFIETALDAQSFSATDDDTKVKLGDRVGVRHHMNSCTLNVKTSGIKVEKRGGVLSSEYRITFPCVLSATYVRIDFGGIGGGKKKESSIREEFEAQAIVSPAKTEVNVVRRTGGSGSGDGRGRMMKHAPGQMTKWLRNALETE